ncbi:MAG: DUF1330 domain-containing protein [Acidimicrobiales bacterium]
MASYVVGTIEISDQQKLAEYGGQVGPIIERHGGRILTIGPVTVLEGDANPHMAALIEFPTAADAAVWYDSDDYGAIRGLRQSAGRTSVLLVDAPADNGD